MAPSSSSLRALTLPRRKQIDQLLAIPAPSHATFQTHFGDAFPTPHFLESDLGSTAVYDLPPPSGQSKRPVLMVHGLNTPALGLWPLAKELQSLDPDAHVVLFDLWGHSLSSTPITAHAPHIFHEQIFQVLAHMKWHAAHILGFSFGGSTAVRFALHNPAAVLSVGLLAPAGLLPRSMFGERMCELIDNSDGREEEATDSVMDFLEGGPLVVPEDWKERSRRGEVVAEALRQWELTNHDGYRQSVLSMFQEGGVTGCEEWFRKFAKLPVKQIGVVAEKDPVCSKGQLVDLGFENVKVVEKADHGFVRAEARTAAKIIFDFWQQD